jgi:hypothetical protein
MSLCPPISPGQAALQGDLGGGADRYCNPDEDVPDDFGDRRGEYYSAGAAVAGTSSFSRSRTNWNRPQLNDTLPANPTVEILSRSDGWIRVTPLPKQEEPANLRYLKQTIQQRWWMTSLLDIVKEVDLRVGFTDSFQSLTGQERLPQPTGKNGSCSASSPWAPTPVSPASAWATTG